MAARRSIVRLRTVFTILIESMTSLPIRHIINIFMIQNDVIMTFQMHSSRYGGCFQVLSSDGPFLTAKKGLLPLKYNFAIDLTCDDSETKYSSPVRAYYEIASLRFYELKTHI